MRKRLPNRRPARTFTFLLGKLEYVATLGYYDRSLHALGEVFIECGKSGSDANLAMREATIALSFALQHGCTVEMIRTAMPRRVSGEAEGPLGTLLDLLAREDLKDAESELLR